MKDYSVYWGKPGCNTSNGKYQGKAQILYRNKEHELSGDVPRFRLDTIPKPQALEIDEKMVLNRGEAEVNDANLKCLGTPRV